MDGPGEHTVEIGVARNDRTAEEKNTRRFGRRCFGAGLGVLVAWNVAALAAAIVTENDLWHNGDAQLFGVLAFVLGCCTGAILTLIGALERIMRPVRERQDSLTRGQQRQGATIARVAQNSEDRFEVIMQMIGAIPTRMNQLEEDHTEIKASLDEFKGVLVALAEKLPDELIARHWRGYNEAVKDGFGQQTGTEGQQRRPPYIGLVRGEQQGEQH